MNFFYIHAVVVLAISMFQFEISLAKESVEQKTEIKEKLKQLTPEARQEALSRAEVIEKKIDKLHRESPEKIAEIDMMQELSQICGSNFNYVNKEFKANVDWPLVTCKYHQAEKVLGGSTNKFLCDFNEINKNGEIKIKTRKVKYKAMSGVKKSELVPSLLASTVARMIGFHTESYCPAVVRCLNCSSSMPWQFGKGRGRASRDIFDFNDAMIEIPADLMTITSVKPRADLAKAEGVDLNDIKKIEATEKKSVSDNAIEREAWLLWLNFVVEMDATNSNQRLACDKASLRDSEVYCEKPMMYTHDYGQSFYRHFQFDKWKKINPLIQGAGETCHGGMTSEVMRKENATETSIEVGPVISSEARDFLVSRLRNISDKQWRDIFRIANTQRLFGVSPDEFLAAVKEKIEIMAQVHCAPFNSRTSVLSQIQN